MWMNQAEIEFAAQNQHACPNVRKGTHLLLRLMQSVNEQSDGWAHWAPPGKSAEKLTENCKDDSISFHAADCRQRVVAPV